MDRYGIILGVYLNKENRAAWLYDVIVDENKNHVLCFQFIENFAYGHHSFHKDRLSEEKFIIPENELYELIEHKNKYEEKWTFLGRIVKQGEYYQVV